MPAAQLCSINHHLIEIIKQACHLEASENNYPNNKTVAFWLVGLFTLVMMSSGFTPPHSVHCEDDHLPALMLQLMLQLIIWLICADFADLR